MWRTEPRVFSSPLYARCVAADIMSMLVTTTRPQAELSHYPCMHGKYTRNWTGSQRTCSQKCSRQAAVRASTHRPHSVTRASQHSVPELQVMLTSRGIDATGLKPDLVARLCDALQPVQTQQQHTLPPRPQQTTSPSPQSKAGLPAQTSRPTLLRRARPTTYAPPNGQPASAPRPPPPDPAVATGMAVTWLGTSSGAPSGKRNVSCIALRLPGATYLVDCGEGTFNQLQRARIDPTTIKGCVAVWLSPRRLLLGMRVSMLYFAAVVCTTFHILIHRIFVTHMHGDHCFGMLGVLRSIAAAAAASGAPRPAVTVHGPPGVQAEARTALRLLSIDLPIDLTVVQYSAPNVPLGLSEDLELGSCHLSLRTLSPEGAPRAASDQPARRARGFSALRDPKWTVRLAGDVMVTAAQLQHRVPCWGYVFAEAPHAGGRKVVLLGDTMDSAAIAGALSMCADVACPVDVMRGISMRCVGPAIAWWMHCDQQLLCETTWHDIRDAHFLLGFRRCAWMRRAVS